MVGSKVCGRLARWNAKLQLDPASLARSSVACDLAAARSTDPELELQAVEQAAPPLREAVAALVRKLEEHGSFEVRMLSPALQEAFGCTGLSRELAAGDAPRRGRHAGDGRKR
jgi:hypothetical protein